MTASEGVYCVQVKVRLFAGLRDVAGKDTIEVTPRGSDVRAALADLFSRCPALRERVLGPGGEILPYVNLFWQGRSVHDLAGLSTPVDGEGELCIFPPLAGGAQPSRAAGA